MQATVTTPQRKPRRNNSRQNAKDTSQASISQNGPDALNAQNNILDQPSSNLSRQFAAIPETHPDSPDMDYLSPKHPRPRSMYDSPSLQEAASKGQRSGNASANEGDAQKKKRGQRSHNRNSESYSNANSTPQRKYTQNSHTPRRTSATPSQAYAGPTFHASPAPSSLPIPKFFSKSVPEVNKLKGLAAMMENEASEGAMSLESSDGSPMLERAERVHNPVREESPLDIFFRADREEKARARQSSSRSPLLDSTYTGPSPEVADVPSGNPSPVLDHVRHHSRHPTGGSTNGLFPIELEDERSNSPANPGKRPSPPTDLSRATSAPSEIMTESVRDEAAKRNASSLALKKLLLTPQPQRSNSVATNKSLSEGKKRHTPPVRESTGPFAPSRTPGPEVRILSRKQPASLPQLQKQFGCTNPDSSPRPRPPSSNLRQEISAPQSPEQNTLPELPASPTPSRNGNLSTPSSSRNQHNLRSGPAFSSLPPTALSGVGPPPMQGMNDVSSMENELKRVLKLDVLGSDGASGVRS